MKKNQGIVFLLFTMMIFSIYQNCGSPNPFNGKIELSSEGTVRTLHTINIQIKEASGSSSLNRIEASGTCDGPENMIAEVLWEISSSDGTNERIRQVDGCIEGEINLSTPFQSLTRNESYTVKATLTPRNIPPEELSRNSVWDSLPVDIDNDSSIKPFIIGNLERRKTIKVGSEYRMTLNAEAPGDGTLIYQWFKNNIPVVDDGTISGQGTNTLFINSVELGHEGLYKVIITLEGGGRVVSNILEFVIVRPIPVIDDDLESKATVKYNEEYEMSITASGSKISENTATLSYQWFKNGTLINLNDEGNNNITIESDKNGSSLTINPVRMKDQGKYKVVVTITGGKTVTSNTLELTVSSPIKITKALLSSSRPKIGSSYSMEIGARDIGGGELTYEWFKDGNSIENGNGISGQNTNKLTINPLSESHAGTYYIIIRLKSDPNNVYVQSKNNDLEPEEAN